jgi:hypothetical protein
MEPSPNTLHMLTTSGYVRSAHMTVHWHLSMTILKEVFLRELVIRGVRNWGFFEALLQLYTRWIPLDFPLPCHFNLCCCHIV